MCSRVEDDMDMVLRTEMNAVAVRQSVAVYLLPIDEGPVFAPLIDNAVFAINQNDFGMVARDTGVGNDEVLLGTTANREWHLLQRDLPLLRAFYEK